MAQNFLPIRILFHATFALVYLATLVITFVIDASVGVISLSALGGLGIFAALDILTIQRNVNQKIFLFIDLFVTICMPGCMYPIISGGIEQIIAIREGYYVGNAGLGRLQDFGYPIQLTAIITTLGLSTFYLLYISIAAVIDKVTGNLFLPRYPDESPPSSPGIRSKIHFIGRKRTPMERAAITDHCASYIFQRSVFRKHSWEPAVWAIFRGITAVYCCIGLFVFTTYEGYAVVETHAAVGLNLQETVFPTSLIYGSYLSVAMNNSASQIIPSDLTVSRWSGYPNLVQSVTGSNSQVWTDSVPGRYQTDVYGYPFIANNDFNVSWSGNVTLDIWATSSDFYGSVDSLPAVYSPGFPLFPFKEYVITLTVINYNVNGLGWLFLEPQIHSAVDSGSNTTTASFSCNWQSQRQTTRRALTSASGLSQFVTAISAIGGIYSFIDVTFALFFGRTILAILFGTRIISPFGLLGVIARNRFRRLIHEQYPYMQEDIDRGGMAAYVSEVAIDAGLTRSLESARGRARVSTPSHDSLGPNADPGIMQLGNMEKSKTGDSTGHSLPYV